MNFEIVKATRDNVKIANEFLTELIKDEKKYDKNINEKCVVNSFYENIYNLDNQFLYFAKVKDKYIGYIYGFIKDDGEAYINKNAVLDVMFVLEEYRNKGIGTSFIKLFQDWSLEKDVKFIELKVCNNNDIAISLYKNNLFEPNKVIMRLELNDN